jgi:hypothetical protein
MSLADRLRAFLAPVPVAKDAQTVAPYAGVLGNFRLASSQFDRGRRHAALRYFADVCEPVRTAINWRKQQVAESRWRIVRTDDPKKPPDPRVVDKVNALLRYVNPTRSSFSELMHQTIEDVVVLDAGCVEKEYDAGGEIVGLWPVDGATIQIDPRWALAKKRGGFGCDPKAIRYREFVNGVCEAELRNDQLIYIMQNPTTHRLRGFSQVEMTIRTIERTLFAEQYASDLLHNPAPPGVMFVSGLTDAQLIAFRAYFNALGPGEIPIAGGDADAGNPGRGGVDFKGIGWSPKDLMFSEFREWLITIIAFVWQIDKTIYGLVDDVNRSTSRTMSSRTDQGFVALALRVASIITRELVAQIDENHGFEFIDLVVQDPLNQAKIDQIYSMCGVYTPNMILSRMGDDPVPWGDAPYSAASAAPVNDPAQDDPNAEDPLPADPPPKGKADATTPLQRAYGRVVRARQRYLATSTGANAQAWLDAEEALRKMEDAARAAPFGAMGRRTAPTKRALPSSSTR